MAKKADWWLILCKVRGNGNVWFADASIEPTRKKANEYAEALKGCGPKDVREIGIHALVYRDEGD